MMNRLVTIDEFIKQVEEVDGAKIKIQSFGAESMVRSYDFERLPDSANIGMLHKRIEYCLRPFIYVLDSNYNIILNTSDGSENL